MPMNPRLLRPLATGGFDADAQAYITAVQAADGQALEQGVKVAINDFVTGCKSDGIWSAIKASCILAGARTLAGALVPLKPLGPELWSPSTPGVFDFGSGSSGAWDAATLTMSNGTTGSDATFPRFRFAVPTVAGRRYRVTGRLSGDTDSVVIVRLATGGFVGYASYNSSTGVISGTVTAAAAFFEVAFNGTLGAKSVTIEELSIREDFTPTNNNFVSGDYDRATGLAGDESTKYLDSNRNNNADPQDDKHVALYVSAAATGIGKSYLGSSANNIGSTRISTGSVDVNWRLHNSSTASVIDVANADLTGFAGMSRAAATGFDTRAQGATVPRTQPSSTPENANIHIFAHAAANHANCRLAFYSIGESLDLADLDTRVSTLITAIGAAI